MNIFSRIKKSVYITSILSIVIGIVFLVNPVGMTDLIAKGIGVVIIIAGAISVIMSLRSGGSIGASGGLIVGILIIAVGLFLVVYSGITLALLGFVIAIYVLVDGIVMADSAIALGRVHASGWFWHLIFAILLIVCGVLLIIRPFSAIEMTGTILGIVLLVDGIIGLITAIRTGRI